VEGRLGGQANVPGAAGTWKDLTGNVNLLAENLTSQVRAIAEVTTAVTKGDLTRSIQVDARGEVAELKDYINTRIGNLRLTTERNTEQDWLKTNLARFTSMLQGQRDLALSHLLSELVPLVNAHQVDLPMVSEGEGSAHFKLLVNTPTTTATVATIIEAARTGSIQPKSGASMSPAFRPTRPASGRRCWTPCLEAFWCSRSCSRTRSRR
jgi:HAMP domain-containing protein